jgi:hypothetical protein
MYEIHPKKYFYFYAYLTSLIINFVIFNFLLTKKQKP